MFFEFKDPYTDIYTIKLLPRGYGRTVALREYLIKRLCATLKNHIDTR